ncbi:MAG: hypothetical protein K2L48_04130 [Mycoplasmoidaceae bacterium]|nr:hypothetical protein [Mycoplasmoidaceae bacterium]
MFTKKGGDFIAKNIFVTVGINHKKAKEDRQIDDFYATDPKALELLLTEENFSHTIWECACGEGHLSKVLQKHNFNVISTDLVYRGFGTKNSIDFLAQELTDFDGDIITNPPYKFALPFIQKALHTVAEGHKVAMLLRLQFLEGKTRKKFFLQNPPQKLYVSSSRLHCAINGKFEKNSSNAIAYAWFIWKKGFQGDPIIKWFN